MNRETLEQKILDLNKAYRFGDAEISDAEFDALVEQYRKLVTEDEFNEFRNSLNEGNSAGAKVIHEYVMGSLDKIKNTDAPALDKFLKEHVVSQLNISAKVDGISSVAKYVNGKLVSLASRGDGYEGTDFTDKAAYIKGLPAKINHVHTVYIRGELVIFNNEDLKTSTNYRNVCAGIMNRKEWTKEDVSHVSFVPYTVLGDRYTKIEQFKLLEELGFNAAWHENIDISSFHSTEKLLDLLTAYAKTAHAYDCDGLVLTDANAKNEFNSYRPKNAMAFKINELTAVTRIIDVDWGKPSKDGFLCPVFILEPVELGGATINRASASNLDIIEKLGAKYGSIVAITKANDIIPHVDSVIDNSGETADIELPVECPCCGTKLMRDGINLRCTNKNCKDQVLTQIAHFIKKLGCKNASEATLCKFNINSFDDLVKFTPNKRYKNEVKLYNELNSNVFTKSKKDLLAATNFEGLSEKLIAKIVDYYGLDNIENGKYSGLPTGIGDITMSKFKRTVLDNLKIVDMFINDSRYKFIDNANITSKDAASCKNGMSICFTGKLNTMSRSDASKLAEKFGFEVKTSVNKNLTYLVTNDANTSSSKGKNARRFGIKTLTEKEFIKMCENTSEDIMDLK